MTKRLSVEEVAGIMVEDQKRIDKLVSEMKVKAPAQMGETSEDGNFTVIEAECLAGCGFPTTVQINSRYYENVMPKDVPEILERLKAQGE